MIQSPRPGPGDMSGDWGNLLNPLAKLFQPNPPHEERSSRANLLPGPIITAARQPQLRHKHCIQSSPLINHRWEETGANTVNTRLELATTPPPPSVGSWLQTEGERF